MEYLSKGLLVLSIYLLTALYWNDLSRQESTESLQNLHTYLLLNIYDKSVILSNYVIHCNLTCLILSLT